MRSTNNIELLAPAKNLECGIAAIRHGADAVYIGAPKFGAREAAGNSVEEIAKLTEEARLFGVKTYVALNTILYDNELAEAEKIIRQVYEAGADALIIQDFGILEMDLPPIALHASTQVNNFTVEKIKFLEAVGFKRAVLARELSLNQIKEITDQTTLEIEAFVHGSLCVSLSGQCFLSYTMGGRSANRGACAQPCRKKYTLTDASGKVIVQNKHLLSLKDLNRSKSIRDLATAGVRSFKIEGRLKDIDYVKNITAYYREELDRILEEKPEFSPASFGKTSFFFTPDPAKTFHRGATEYYLRGRQDPVSGMDTPKSIGEKIGKVISVTQDSIRISGSKQITNNDGLTFVNHHGESSGLKINRIGNGAIYPDKMNGVFVGAILYRNYDQAFQMTLGKKTAERKIPVVMALAATPDGFELYGNVAHDSVETGYASNCTLNVTITPKPISTPPITNFAITMAKIPANNPSQSRENILRQLAKSGDTPFLVRDIETGGNEQYFFTAQQLNELRRGLFGKMRAETGLGSIVTLSVQLLTKPVTTFPITNTTPYPTDPVHFELNISNRLAQQFYRRHGIEKSEMSVEKRVVAGRLQVMVTKHCLQYELGYCSRFGGTSPSHLTEPFTLQDGTNHFELEFDCRNCLMKIFKEMGKKDRENGTTKTGG